MHRLRRWFAKPGDDAAPEETLRWVARIALAVAVLGLLSGLRRWAMGDDLWWIMAASGGLLVVSAVLLRVAAAAAARNAPPQDGSDRGHVID